MVYPFGYNTADRSTSLLTPQPAEMDNVEKIFEYKALWLHFQECKALFGLHGHLHNTNRNLSFHHSGSEVFKSVSDARPEDEMCGLSLPQVRHPLSRMDWCAHSSSFVKKFECLRL